MSKETAGFREMGYSPAMGLNTRSSISGTAFGKAPRTDVNRDASSFSKDSLHRSKKGRSGLKRMGKRK